MKKQMVLLAALLAVMTTSAYAGTGGTEFDAVWDKIEGWTQGTLGRIIALVLIIVGVVGGIARQSLLALAVGVGCGLGLFTAPSVLEAVMTANG